LQPMRSGPDTAARYEIMHACPPPSLSPPVEVVDACSIWHMAYSLQHRHQVGHQVGGCRGMEHTAAGWLIYAECRVQNADW
jgi:hypothetical protein